MRLQPRQAYELPDVSVVKWPHRTDIGPSLVPLFDYWETRRNEAGLLAKADVDPLNLPPAILPYLVLIEVLRDPLDFFFHVIGTHICEIAGRDATGERLSQLSLGQPSGNRQAIHHIYSLVANEAVVVAEQGRALSIDKRHFQTRCLFLPVTRGDSTVDYIFGGVVYTPLRS